MSASVGRVPAGVGFAVAAALLFGLCTPCAKLLAGETPPLLLAGAIVAGGILGPVLLMPGLRSTPASAASR